MLIQENISLKPYNTFSVDVTARYFATFYSINQLNEVLGYKKFNNKHSALNTLILGGGSNILFTKNFNGLILKNELRGIKIIKEDEHHVYVQAGAGENWHQFVLHCIEHDWAGLENLSLIPGNVGASPIQNIGAYGVEIKDIFYLLEALHIKSKKIITFSANDCQFGYRESIFKKKFKNEFIILNVTYRLNKIPNFNISYGAIEQELQRMNISDLTIKSVSDAVISIRSAKLPDPTETGNAGSFFKNPEVSADRFKKLYAKFPHIIGYTLPDKRVKLAAGWLIEQCGWKGYRIGDAGCHAKQALVLINYGNAKGNDIYNLSKKIENSVKEKFGIKLEREVNIR